MNTNELVKEFVRTNLSPNDAERKAITKKYDDLSSILDGRVFQSGSYSRFTAITPVNDLDVIWVLPEEWISRIEILKGLTRAQIDPNSLDVRDLLKDLANRIESEYKKLYPTIRVKPQSHSVGIYFGRTDDEFSIDVVPAIPLKAKNNFGDEIYLVPELLELSKYKRVVKYASGEEIQWITSDPLGYKQEAKILDDQTDHFRKATKLVKKWKYYQRGIYSKLKIKSFHLELVVSHIIKNNPKLTMMELLTHFFSSLPIYFQSQHFPDRADNGRYCDEYVEKLTPEQKSIVNTISAIALGNTNRVSTCSNPDQLPSLLQELLQGKKPEGTVKPSDAVQQTGLVDPIVQWAKQNYPSSIERFLEDDGFKFMDKGYTVEVDAYVDQNGMKARQLLSSTRGFWRQAKLEYFIKTDILEPYTIKWKVRNTGTDAAGNLRGEISDDLGNGKKNEHIQYRGNHYVEGYVFKDGQWIGRGIVILDIPNFLMK